MPKKESLERALHLVKLRNLTICSDAYNHDEFPLPGGADSDAISHPTSEKDTFGTNQPPLQRRLQAFYENNSVL